MSAFAYIINKPDNTIKYGLGVDNPDNFMNRVSQDKLMYLKFFPKRQLRYVENNFHMFVDNDEIIKNFDNVYIFFNEICYNSFIKEQIRLDEEDNDDEFDNQDIKYKKKFSVRIAPKIILIKPKKCYNKFDKNNKQDKPDKSNRKRKYILCH